MQYATAVIQSSLFEGWSTVIEDAKLLGKQVIASGINVHKDQLGRHGIYFDPHSEINLVNTMNNALDEKANLAVPYSKKAEEFGSSFSQVLEKVIAI